MVLSSVVLTLRSFGLGAVLVCCCLIGTGCAFANAAGQALLADLVDRHKLGGYGMAFALSDMADSLGFILGPIIGLAVSQKFGASAGVGVLGASCLLLAPSVLRIGV
jgi:MFS family permease